MIRLQRISTADGFLYEYMEQLITTAFPPEEYRPLGELRLYTDSKPHFHNNIIFHHDTPVGFITYWDFGKFYYVEHFAVDPVMPATPAPHRSGSRNTRRRDGTTTYQLLQTPRLCTLGKAISSTTIQTRRQLSAYAAYGLWRFRM